MRMLLTSVVVVIATPALAVEMLSAHYWGENDYVAPQPVELKLTASGESVRLSTRVGPLEEFGVTLTAKSSLAVGGQDAQSQLFGISEMVRSRKPNEAVTTIGEKSNN